MTEGPILTYTDASLNRRQTLTLWADKVQLSGKLFLRGEYEASFPIDAISPDHQTVTVRDNSFGAFVCLTLITGGFACLYHAIPGTSIDSFLGGLIAVVPIAPFVASLVTFKKVRIAQFLSPQGQLLFGIVKGGKEKHRFEEVVAGLITQIRKAKPKG